MATLPGARISSQIINTPVLLITIAIISTQLLHFSTVAQVTGFLSIDCGSPDATNYTDPSTQIQWKSDAARWPDIGNWSASAVVSPPASMADQKQYTTLRYFPQNKVLNHSKFCYNLPATAGSYYLIRATFWLGLSPLYETRASGQIRFHMIVDTYEGVEIVINIPQSYPWFEEMYVRAQSGRSSLSMCLSASSDSSDIPFINSLEVRPLPSTLTPVKMVSSTNFALRTVDRKDFGSVSADPPILRYPNDSLDRFWWRSMAQPGNANITSQPVNVNSILDLPPEAVLQTNFIGSNLGYFYNVSDQNVLTTSTVTGKHSYCLSFWFVELDTRVEAAGQRVFNLTSNGYLLLSGIDIFASVKALYTTYQLYSSSPYGPYEDELVIEAYTAPTSLYPPSIAGAEILQLFDNPMNGTAPTSTSDVTAIQDIIATTLPSLLRFTGDPCLPLGYKYSWIDCDYTSQPVPRVTSMSLSNSSLVGNIPSSINNLDQIVTLLLGNNALEGPLPSFSKLVNLQSLDLSNNKLSGSIPDSFSDLLKLTYLDLSNNKLSGPIPDLLSNLPKLTYLNLANNNLSGTIPATLLQKQGLRFRYEGNSFLCVTSNATCGNSPSILKSKQNKLGLIIGASVGAILFCIIIIVTILCILRWRKNRTNLNEVHSGQYNSIYQDTNVNPKKEELINNEDIINATNVAQKFSFEEITIATNNFSHLLGQGGFGLVYKGNLPNGSEVAVKMLSNTSQQGPQEFLNEVTLLSRVHHKNLVGFMGYSIEKSLVLVYEFMSNGSLHDALSRRKPSRGLTWLERLQLLSDAAQGLAYLHHGCNIIHRDVKSSNILLSHNLEGKMSDFGISKLASNDADPTTRIVGTMGYLDPEYATTLSLTTKVDIYSFGVVILEVVCGREPVIKDPKNENGDILITEWVRSSYEQGAIEEVVDNRLENEYNVSSVWKVVEIAMACVHSQGKKRPTMYTICNDLDEAVRIELNSESSAMNTGEVSSKYSNVEAR